MDSGGSIEDTLQVTSRPGCPTAQRSHADADLSDA